MPFTGPLVSVTVAEAPFGALVTLRNGSGSRRSFRVGQQTVTLDGNTTVGVPVSTEVTELKVWSGSEQVWPVLQLDSTP